MQEIVKDVIYLGSKHPDRKYFDELVPLPEGTSYNSYLIKGSEKTALIDSVYPQKTEELMDKLEDMDLKLDFIIANHAEQDHSGTIPKLLEKYPEAMVVTNPKCAEFLQQLVMVDKDRIIITEDNKELSLGNKTLKFMFAPWVHWPDTMFTYLKEDKILFTCDFFGSHLADGELFIRDASKVEAAAKRYYAEIMMPFAQIFQKYFARIDELELDYIAPSHGPIYQDPKFIIDLYKSWSSPNDKDEIVILHTSMYGSTAKMIEYLEGKFKDTETKIVKYDAMDTDIGELAMDLVDAKGLIVASPMVLSGPHPNLVSHLYLINAIKPKLKYYTIIGSYSWGGLMIDTIKKFLANIKAQYIPEVFIKGHPKEEDYKKLDELFEEIRKHH